VRITKSKPRWCSLVLACLALLIPSPLAKSSARAPQDEGGTCSVLSEADAALQSGNPDAAIRALRAWLRRHAGDTRARLLLGKAYEASGDLRSAETQFQIVLKTAPQSLQALAALGTLYEGLGEPGKAEPLLARAATLSNNSEAARLAWAVVLAKLHRYRKAAEALQGTRLPERPSEQIAYFRLKASVELGNGNGKAAARDMESALARAPQDMNLQLGTAVAETELAVAEFRAGRLDAALANATRGQSLHESAPLDNLIGDIQERRGASLDAVHSYQRAVSLEPEREQYWLDLAFELLRHETYNPALIVLQQAARRFPSSVRIQIAAGVTEYLLEDYPAAVHSLLSASQVHPASGTVIDYLGETLLRQPTTPEADAVKAVCRYADLHPGRAEELAYCGALMARVEHDRGGVRPSPDALRRLRVAAQLAPANALAQCELGENLEWAGEWAESRAQMEACVRLEPGSAEAHYRLARIYAHLGQAELARKQTILHDQAVQRMVKANAQRDATLRKFLYTMKK
jgi:tetratricopeptide (TPR) repeat protein